VQLLRLLRTRGLYCAAMKPICCGDRRDAELLLAASSEGHLCSLCKISKATAAQSAAAIPLCGDTDFASATNADALRKIVDIPIPPILSENAPDLAAEWCDLQPIPHFSVFSAPV
jgi:hypothetical protein